MTFPTYLMIISAIILLIGIFFTKHKLTLIGSSLFLGIILFLAVLSGISTSNQYTDYTHPEDIIDIAPNAPLTYRNSQIHYTDKYNYEKDIVIWRNDTFSIVNKNVDSPRIIKYPIRFESSFYRFFLGDPVQYMYEATFPEPLE